MALVDYASSDEDEDEDEDDTEKVKNIQTIDETQANLKKRKRDNKSSSELPPLPSKFHNLYASTTRLSTRDDPHLHGGRKRVTPHVEGNWPTHLYIEWFPATVEHESLKSLISASKGTAHSENPKLHSFLTSDLGAPLPLHISLSRPIGFATEQKDAFLASFEIAINSSGIRPFDVLFSSLDWVPNFEKKRWFLVLRTEIPELNDLNKLLHISNKIVQEYGQPPLYAKASEASRKTLNTGHGSNNAPRQSSQLKVDWTGMEDVSDAFHVSIAWTLEPPSQGLLEITNALATDRSADLKQFTVTVEEIKAKIGNVVTGIRLRKGVSEGNGLFGF